MSFDRQRVSKNGGAPNERALSREHLTKWEPAWGGGDELSRNSFRRRVRHYAREASEDLGYAFAIFNVQGDTLLGGITLSNVSRGVSQAATLGYWMGKPFVRQGTMSRGAHRMCIS